MTKIRTIDDIERDKRKEEKEKAKEEISQDIKDIMGKVFPKKEKQKKKFSWIKFLLKLFGCLVLLLIFVTIILGCVWLIKFFIGGIF